MTLRIGQGYDLHRLEPPPPKGQGRPFILGGVLLDHDLGPVGHSDGDALYHAVTDALLGALALPDIGQLFPDNAPENENRNSAHFLTEAINQIHNAGYTPINLDCTIILERPKISPHKETMRNNIANLLSLDPSAVNVKGKTHERVDAIGEGKAVETHAVVLLKEISKDPAP